MDQLRGGEPLVPELPRPAAGSDLTNQEEEGASPGCQRKRVESVRIGTQVVR